MGIRLLALALSSPPSWYDHSYQNVNLSRRHMKSKYTGRIFRSMALIFLACLSVMLAGAQQSHGSRSAANSVQAQVTGTSSLPASALIQPGAFAAALKTTKTSKPLIIHVGFRVLYTQAHIPGSEYIGPGNGPEGINQLRNRVESLPRTQSIVIYCGCCPWHECPNVDSAYRQLRTMGFKDVKVLYIAQNFGKDWVDKGFPVEKGK
jgi:thiosulfate/3-mercaptopyruvate sulfurtransferase